MRAPSAFLPNMRQYHRGRGESRMVWGQRASLSVAGSVLLMGCLLSSVAAAPDDNLPPKSLPVPDVVAEVLPSVVSVMAHGPIRLAPSQTLPSGSGSGIIISPGYILTSNHLVTGATRLVVGLYDGRLVPGRVVGRDFLTDLALVKVEIEGLVPVKLGRSSRLRIGVAVVAIGNPLERKGGATRSGGVVSAVERGMLIVGVESERTAAQAGLSEGDVVTAVDITQVYNMSDLWHALLKDGSPSLAVTLSVVRKSTQEKIPLKRPVTK